MTVANIRYPLLPGTPAARSSTPVGGAFNINSFTTQPVNVTNPQTLPIRGGGGGNIPGYTTQPVNPPAQNLLPRNPLLNNPSVPLSELDFSSIPMLDMWINNRLGSVLKGAQFAGLGRQIAEGVFNTGQGNDVLLNLAALWGPRNRSLANAMLSSNPDFAPVISPGGGGIGTASNPSHRLPGTTAIG